MDDKIETFTRTEPLEVSINGESFPFTVNTNGKVENLEMTIVAQFSAAIQACKDLNDEVKKSIKDLIEEKGEVILTKWWDSSDPAKQARDCIDKLFSTLPDLDNILALLVGILNNLLL